MGQIGVPKVTESHDHSAESPPKVVVLRLENRLPEFLVNSKKYQKDFLSRTWAPGMRFRVMFRKLNGAPDSYYQGIITGSLPYLKENNFESGRGNLVPWGSLLIEWDPTDNSSASD